MQLIDEVIFQSSYFPSEQVILNVPAVKFSFLCIWGHCLSYSSVWCATWINLYALTGSKRTWLSRLNLYQYIFAPIRVSFFSRIIFHVWNYLCDFLMVLFICFFSSFSFSSFFFFFGNAIIHILLNIFSFFFSFSFLSTFWLLKVSAFLVIVSSEVLGYLGGYQLIRYQL